MPLHIGPCTITVEEADITGVRVDAIVNAANSSLLGGGGVDGAIHARGGPEILEACKRERERLGGLLPTGAAVITPGGRLPAPWVIHTVGPVYHCDPDPEKLLAACYRSCLDLAIERGLGSVAFPAISCGAYGFPVPEAAEIALRTTRDRVLSGAPALREIRHVLFGDTTFAIFRGALARLSEEPGSSAGGSIPPPTP